MKRRIMFDKTNGKILMMKVANELIPNENIGMILQNEEIDKEKFDNSRDIRIDIKTNQIIFEKIQEKEKTKEELEKELLEAKATIVDLQYKDLLKNKDKKVGK